MDTFIDKLSHKLTAQEMINANSAADAKEMDQLKDKLQEYNECLEKLQKMIEDGVNKLENAQVDCGEINRLVDESIERINKVQHDTEVRMNAQIYGALGELKQKLGTQPNVIEELKKLLDEKPDTLEDLKTFLNEKQTAADDHVHKESVKVYRNVQAVVVEENNKQTEVLNNSIEAMNQTVAGMSGKINKIYTVSVWALLLALGSLAIQVFGLLN